ncbi:Enoyl-CoA hydratase/carnithine racemase [Actinopolyspora mzabensis]|uniref:Enoyl-CoA hydratase/carnithine racemase n=1 Tax=Actinopolyspora mzabensis TaxID=995066 RepID=A0A1G9EHC2_ACTMZ|nr:enoyl-CoA hydratase/isomerase family protein [Actinopolyspora mzabensis]SDK75488.1 Enoyl-CoA hydratase/carnithine racemase [Actinopolyspora mzabensis]
MSTGFEEVPPVAVRRPSSEVVELTVGDATKRNALDRAGWDLLRHAVERIGTDETVRVVVIRGREGTFCAGSDMTEWVDADMDSVEDSFSRMEAAFQAVERCPVPVIAEITGVAAGAGCQLALACDLRYMSTSARIGMPIIRLGINTSPAFAKRLVVLVGPARARRLLYTGELLAGVAAVHEGLVERAVPEAELTERTGELLTTIVEKPPAAIRAAKTAVATALEHPPSNDTPAVDPETFPASIKGFLGV